MLEALKGLEFSQPEGGSALKYLVFSVSTSHNAGT